MEDEAQHRPQGDQLDADVGAADGEGLATRRNVLIDAGRLTGFVYDTYSGRRAGKASTGSAVRSSRSTP